METQEKPLVNKVAQSGLITLELENFYPAEEWVELDLADFLFKKLILKEKDFREQINNYDWQALEGKNLRVYCSTDAIVPPWALMVIARHAHGIVAHVEYGTFEEAIEKLMIKKMEQNLNPDSYRDKRVLIKGCSTKTIPRSIYMHITGMLMPLCKSLMYGEACSNVPVYKQPIRRKK